MNLERDKYLTIAMGKCWHERKDFSDDGYGTYSCKHCNCIKDFAYSNLNPNFSTWTGFGVLFKWSQKQDWWQSFGDYVYSFDSVYQLDENNILRDFQINILEYFIDPDKFADAVYKFLNK